MGARAGEKAGWVSSLRLAAADIKLAHSVFAMPFAVLGAFVARPVMERGEGAGWLAGVGAWGKFGVQLALVVVCMVLARTWAMLVNRIADRGFDAENPRTVRRAVASGALSVGSARLIALGCAVSFVGVCALFGVLFGNWWPMWLSVPVLGWIALYSYTKRFTWLCHVFLGGALAASPLAAAIAVRPESLTEWSVLGHVAYHGHGAGPTLALLAGMVLLWVAGFDVIYALQDVEFDRGRGLHSIPARLGPEGAAWVSRGLHAGAFVCLVLAGAGDWRFGWLFDSAVGLVGVLLVTEHVILAARGKAGLDMAFFTVNGVVSCVLGVAGVVDLVAV